MSYFKGSHVTYKNENCIVLGFDEEKKLFNLYNPYTGESYRNIPSTSVELHFTLQDEKKESVHD